MNENCGPHSAGPTDSDRSQSQTGKCPVGHFTTEDDYNEWELGIGDLIIDLDADIEKTHSSSPENKTAMASSACTSKSSVTKPNSPIQSHPETGASSSLKMKIKKTRSDDKSREVKHEIILSNEEAVKGTSQSKNKGKSDKDRSQSTGLHKDTKRDKVTTVRVTDSTNGCKSSAAWSSDFSYASKCSANDTSIDDTTSPAISKVTIDHSPESSSSALRKHTGTSTSVGTITDPECLGPCEPGTSVTLEGIVWQETDGGVLVVNVTWRGKSYVGTLLDCTKHDWAPPRLCESPEDCEIKVAKGRGKRAGRSVVVEVKKSNNNKGGRRTQNSGFTIPNQPSGSENGDSKRKQCNRNEEPPSPGCKRSRSRNESGSLDTTCITSTCTATSGSASPALIECPEPNCSKKYKHINGLKYHQSHAHSDAPTAVKLDALEEPEADEVTTPVVASMDTSDAVDTVSQATISPKVLEDDPEKYIESAAATVAADGHSDSVHVTRDTNPTSPAYSDISDANDNENGQDTIESPASDVSSKQETKSLFQPFSFTSEETLTRKTDKATASTDCHSSKSSAFSFTYSHSLGNSSANGVKDKHSTDCVHVSQDTRTLECSRESSISERNVLTKSPRDTSLSSSHYTGVKIESTASDKCQRGVTSKLIVQSKVQPPPPPPPLLSSTSGFLFHSLNSTPHLQASVSPFTRAPFSSSSDQPEVNMFTSSSNHAMFNNHLTPRLPGQRPCSSVSPEVIKKPCNKSNRFANHSVKDASTDNFKAKESRTTPPVLSSSTSTSSSSSLNSTDKLDTTSTSKANGNDARRDSSPPPSLSKRHLHTHHHTHVNFPLYDPYGAIIASQQAAAQTAFIHLQS